MNSSMLLLLVGNLFALFMPAVIISEEVAIVRYCVYIYFIIIIFVLVREFI